MTDLTTPTVAPPPDQDDAPETRRSTWGWWLLGSLVVLALLAALGGSAYTTDRVAFRPGAVSPTGGLIEVGDGPEQFPPEGEFLFLTVNVKRLNFWEWVEAQYLDDADDVVDAELVFGDQTREERREADLRVMETSKSLAALVALDYLGYDVADPVGVLVTELVDDAPVDGLVEAGDIIVGVDGTQTLAADELVGALADYAPGDSTVLEVRRGDDVTDVEVTLGDRGDGSAFLGVAIATRYAENDLPFEIDVDSGAVGGPSAGLAFTLSIIDRLAEGEQTGGNTVAVTGTIDANGCVGPVGGVKQKTISAERAGADVLIVPVENVPDAEPHAGDMEVVGVTGLDEAIEALVAVGADFDDLPELDLACER